MTDALKGVYKLKLGADGRSAENQPSYKVLVDNTLAGKNLGAIILDDVINNVDTRVAVADPGTEAQWLIANPAEVLIRTPALYAVELTNFRNYRRANKMAHGLLMSTLPPAMQDEAAQRSSVHELWTHLEARFGGQTLISVL